MPKKAAQSKKPSFIHPVAFARFPSGPEGRSLLYYDIPQKDEIYSCNKTTLFHPQTDVCAPITKTAAELETKPYSYRWGFIREPELIYWQQELPAGQEFAIELQSELGLPLPANIIIEKSNNLYTAIIRFLSPLPLNKKLLVVSSSLGKTKNVQQRWIQYFQIDTLQPRINTTEVGKVVSKNSLKKKRKSSSSKKRKKH